MFVRLCAMWLALLVVCWPLSGAGAYLAPEGPQPDTVDAAQWAGGNRPAQATPHRPNRLVFHWTAGTWTQTFTHYHFNVRGDGQWVNTYPAGLRAAHVWKRNTGALGVSACAGAGASIIAGRLVNTRWPLLPVQIEAMAKGGAELCLDWKIDPNGMADYGGGQCPTLTGHHFWAALDGYGADRSEMGAYWPDIVKKLRWYHAKLRSGAAAFEHTRKGGVR